MGPHAVLSALGVIALCASAQAAVITYDAPKGARLSADYEVTVEGKPVAVYRAPVYSVWERSFGGPYSFAYFDFSGSVEVRIASNTKSLSNVTIQPASKGIQLCRNGNAITFALTNAPCQISIEPDSKNGPLLLFANPPEQGIPGPADSGVIYYGPGNHTVGNISLSNGQTLYIAGGAVVNGAVTITGSKVRIRGRGILDATTYSSAPAGACNLISAYQASDVGIEGIIAKDSWTWNVRLMQSSNVVFQNFKLIGSRTIYNDGIDICNSSDVLIEDSFIRSGDDCIATKGGYDTPKRGGQGSFLPVKNITVRRCVLWSDHAQAVRIACESKASTMSDMYFSDIDVIHLVDIWFHEEGQNRKDNVEGWGPKCIFIMPGGEMPVENIHFDDIRIRCTPEPGLNVPVGGVGWTGRNAKALIDVRPQPNHYGEPLPGKYIKNCSFRNIAVTGDERCRLGRIDVGGPDPDHYVRDIRFENILRFGEATTANSPEVHIVGAASNVTFATSQPLLMNASGERAFVNSLGMEFLPAGTSNVLVSRWETRVQDFAAFVQATGYDAISESTDGKRPFTLEADAANASGYDWKQADGSWQDPHFPQTPEHPATCLSYHDAERFCAWLNRHEANQGKLPSGWGYRLPTDAEWNRAAGAAEYPWGSHWPPATRDGNYCGIESRTGFTDTPKWKYMEIFRDLHPRTAPVGSYTPNAFGLFDMGGNVWEWCGTWYQTNLNQADLNDPAIVQGFPALLDDGGGRQNRVVRGGSWHAQRQVDLRTRFRGIGDPRIRFDDFGFRCVLARDEAVRQGMDEPRALKPAAAN